ncbi:MULTISPECIES: hypothetical protein [Sphingobacterium]|nr:MULTISPECIES: hypothetical protein [Sphingobacterium]MCW2258722.1 hypothetical protein [Sphingobacterium kitahiroshimense]
MATELNNDRRSLRCNIKKQHFQTEVLLLLMMHYESFSTMNYPAIIT